MVMNHRNHHHRAKRYEKGEICNYFREIVLIFHIEYAFNQLF